MTINLFNARTGKESAMTDRFTLSLSSVVSGQLVTCHNVKTFVGGIMTARVLDDAQMHRPAREGMAWVRQTGLDVDPRHAWVTEWPIKWMS
jgi:hypothetical protein